MPKEINSWFTSWFNTPYYHILYQERDHREAAAFMNKLTAHIGLPIEAKILDLACGRGRHSKYLYRKGFDVTGVDISRQSIDYAKEYERPRLHFEVHDMRENYPHTFDAVFNLFTSFGYFEDEHDNLKVITTIKNSLTAAGTGVIDFMNAPKSIENLVPEEYQSLNGLNFHIRRYLDDDFIVKEINFTDKGEEFQFVERVRALTYEDFLGYFAKAEVHLKDVFGDYNLNPYEEKSSERLILLFGK